MDSTNGEKLNNETSGNPVETDEISDLEEEILNWVWLHFCLFLLFHMWDNNVLSIVIFITLYVVDSNVLLIVALIFLYVFFAKIKFDIRIIIFDRLNNYIWHAPKIIFDKENKYIWHKFNHIWHDINYIWHDF